MRIYVGTYAKYNDGNLFGEWLDLEDYADLVDFYDACYELHKDETDPELMFQDWEGIPDDLISECTLHEEIYELVELKEDEREMVYAYINCVGMNQDLEWTIKEARESWVSCYKFDYEYRDFLYETFFEVYDVPDELVPYICREAATETMGHAYIASDGFIFQAD